MGINESVGPSVTVGSKTYIDTLGQKAVSGVKVGSDQTAGQRCAGQTLVAVVNIDRLLIERIEVGDCLMTGIKHVARHLNAQRIGERVQVNLVGRITRTVSSNLQICAAVIICFDHIGGITERVSQVVSETRFPIR